MKKLTWIGDIRAGLLCSPKWTPTYYNDATDNQRRIKFYTNAPLDVNRLAKLQEVIEKRRPHLNVSVKGHYGPMLNETYVYYRPKVQIA
jgi:hypothetical protein